MPGHQLSVSSGSIRRACGSRRNKQKTELAVPLDGGVDGWSEWRLWLVSTEKLESG